MTGSTQDSSSEFDDEFEIFSEILSLEREEKDLNLNLPETPALELLLKNKLISEVQNKITDLKRKVSSTKTIEIGSSEHRKKIASNAINERHNQEGGYRDKKKKMVKIFLDEKYTTYAECALKHHGEVGVTYRTALKYLAGQPKPE